MALVFVYGSMKYNSRGQEHSNYQRIKNLRGKRVGKGALPFHRIYFLQRERGGGICCLNPGNSGDVVFGEIFTVPDEALTTLDQYEGTPNVYVREQVEIVRIIGGQKATVKAWVYRFNCPEGFLEDEAIPIYGGNYVESEWMQDLSLSARYK